MKRRLSISSVLFIILLTSIQLSAQERASMIGADLTAGLTESRLTVIMGYAFAERWSIEGRLGMALGHLPDTPDKEESTHDMEFDTEGETCPRSSGAASDSSTISICFWAVRAYHGSFISLGGNHDGGDFPDLTFGMGYVIHLWKGLSAAVSFNMDIMETYRNSAIKGKGISAGICYVF